MNVSSSRKLLAVVIALMTGVVAAGCGGGGQGSSESKELTVGAATGWAESEAVSNLSKLVLEQDLGYENVEVPAAELGVVFQGVANGDYDAYQDVWTPNHTPQLEEVGDDVEQLDPWFQGETRFSLAVPSYMRTNSGDPITSIDQLNDTDATEILGIEPGAVIMEAIPENTIPEYDLKQRLIEASTPAMLAQVEERTQNEEPFVFIAWSPHWMNTEYDFTYLEDPKKTLTNAEGVSLTQPSEISSIVRDDLREDDPVAYAFLEEFTLTEEQVNEIEAEIRQADDDALEGARAWLEGHRDVVQPWVDAARQAEEQAQTR